MVRTVWTSMRTNADAAHPGLMSRMRGRALAASLALLGMSSLAAATTRFELFPESTRAAEFEENAGSERLRLGAGIASLADTPETAPADESSGLTQAAPAPLPFWERPDVSVDVEAFRPLPPGGIPPRPLFDTRTTLTSGGVLFFAGVYALSSPITYGFEDFHFHSEHWFGPNTYGGGADKVSHFIVSASLARELALLYDGFGHTREQSIALGFGVAAFTGLMVEIGDGLGPYGFSWEDLTMDVLGSATGLFLTRPRPERRRRAARRKGADDRAGVRIERVSRVELLDRDLQRGPEDLGPRAAAPVRPGSRALPADVRHLQHEGVRIRSSDPDRQRLVGLELGLNLPEILSAAGVPATTWWESLLYKSLNFFRIPYTSFGWRYDLNHNKWHGPDTGDKYYRRG